MRHAGSCLGALHHRVQGVPQFPRSREVAASREELLVFLVAVGHADEALFVSLHDELDVVKASLVPAATVRGPRVEREERRSRRLGSGAEGVVLERARVGHLLAVFLVREHSDFFPPAPVTEAPEEEEVVEQIFVDSLGEFEALLRELLGEEVNPSLGELTDSGREPSDCRDRVDLLPLDSHPKVSAGVGTIAPVRVGRDVEGGFSGTRYDRRE